MTEETRKKIKEQIEYLPKDSQEAIASLDWMIEAAKIAEEYNIFDEDSDKLIAEVALVLCGLEFPEELVDNIAENVDIEKADAEIIVGEINERIFKPIADKRLEIIKQNIKTKEPDWKKSMNFILSGGNYMYLGDEGVQDKKIIL